MKKYLLLRITSMILNMAVIITVTYFALSFAKYVKYTDMVFSEYLEYTWISFKEYVQYTIIDENWGFFNRWGFNPYEGDPFWEVLVERMKISLKINFVAFFIYVPLGILLGVVAALLRNTIVDRFIIYITTILSSVPIYIVMFLLVMFVGYFWGIVNYSFNPDHQYLIPVLALMIHPVAIFSKVIRGEIVESLSSDYILLARTKGLSKNQAIVRHTSRNSLIALLPEIPTAFLFTLSGSFLVELIYHVHGVAELFYNSMISISPVGTNYVNIEISVVLVISVFYTTCAFLVSFVCDLVLRLLDPRIHIEGKKV